MSWNGAEESWDCPCHGSRFAATGEVYTATTALADKTELWPPSTPRAFPKSRAARDTR